MHVCTLILLIGLVMDPLKADAAPIKAALLGVELINSSLEPISDTERERLERLKSELAVLLSDSGRYEILPFDARAQNQSEFSNCAVCRIRAGRTIGADQVVWGTVQKVSNLILNINVYIDDVASGQSLIGASVDIRGNTDESWQRGIRYLVKHNILHE